MARSAALPSFKCVVKLSNKGNNILQYTVITGNKCRNASRKQGWGRGSHENHSQRNQG